MLRGGKYCRNCPPKRRIQLTCEWCNASFYKYTPFKDSGVICKDCVEWLKSGAGDLPGEPNGRHPIYADKSWAIPSALPSFIGEMSLPYPVNDSQFKTAIEEYKKRGGQVTVLPAMPDSSFDGFFKTQSLEYSPYGNEDKHPCSEEKPSTTTGNQS